MSKFTTELRYICETTAGLTESKGFNDVDEIVKNSYRQVLGTFPIFDEAYRELLSCKIIKHYYTREICAESVGLWKLWVNNRLNEIMPYYNKLYETELLKFNPLYDVDYTESKTGENKTVGNSESEGSVLKNKTEQNGTNYNGSTNSNGNSIDKYSDTPQGAITNLDEDRYLTNARIITENESTTANSTTTQNNLLSDKTDDTRNTTNNVENTEQYILRVQGKRNGASYSTLLNEFRSTLLNIDKMIIEELNDLFFGLW